MEEFAIQLIIMVVFGAITAAIASSKGRSPAGWFFVGFFFTLFGLIVACIASNVKERKARDEAMERENRRLREQLMQEQIKNEAFRQHAAARLDAHDDHIGVDTRSLTTGLPSPDNPQALTSPEHLPLPSTESDAWRSPLDSESRNLELSGAGPAFAASGGATNGAPSGMQNQRQWYYEVQGSAQGPISDNELLSLAQRGIVVDSTLVWTQQLGNWKTAGTIKSLKPHLRS